MERSENRERRLRIALRSMQATVGEAPPLRLDLPSLLDRQRRGRRKFLAPRERPTGVDDRLGVGSDAAFLVVG